MQAHRLQRHEVPGFIEAWNTAHDSLLDADARKLTALGHRVGLEDASQYMLRGSYHDRAMTIIALGHLRDRRMFDAIEPFLSDRSPIVSLCAARALSQVDPPRAMAMFVPMIVERIDAGRSFVCVNTDSVAEEEVKYTLDDDGFVKELSKEVVGGLGEAVGINFVAPADKAALVTRLAEVGDQDYFERGIEVAIEKDGLQVVPVDVSDLYAVEVDFAEDLERANEFL